MIKTRKRGLALLLVLAMVATMMIGIVPTASAAGNIEALTVPTVADDDGQALGTIKVTVPGGAINAGDSVTIKLPDDWTFGTELDTVDDASGTADNLIYVPDYVSAGGDDNGMLAEDITLTELNDADDNEIQLTADVDQQVYDFVFYVYLRDINVEEGTDGECVVTFDGPAGSGFPQGTVTVARVASEGSVTIAVTDDETDNSDFSVTMRVKEDVLGSLKAEDETLKFTLPDGYNWEASNEATYQQVNALWGNDIAVDINVDEEELTIDLIAVDRDGDGFADEPADQTTDMASAWEFTFTFEVVDEDDVEAGDINVKVRGETTASPTTLAVGEYGEFGVKVTADDPTDVLAGKCEQAIADITIEETLAGSLLDGRYITLTLPSWAKWTSVPDLVSDGSPTLTFASVMSSEGQTVKYTIASAGTTAGELEFEDMEIAIDAGASGDVKVTIGGNSGLEGEVVVAKVGNSLTAAASGNPDVKIGVASQKVADMTLTEVVAGAIADEAYNDAAGNIILKVPAGVEFAKVPTVTVTAGDLKIDTSNIRRSKVAGDDYTDFYKYLFIPIDNESTEVSTITISDIYLSVDRTVAEGALKIAVLGNAVLESNSAYTGGVNVDDAGDVDYTMSNGLFPQTAALTAAVVGTVVTPAPGDVKASASFVIGSTTYKLNGVDQTMDVAPYIKDSRTFMPLRYVGMAMGVSEQNIIWDDAAKTVTLMKGDKVVQVKIGSTTMWVNGVAITMDVAPEITSDRTMLPIRFLANAFGATTGWDAATNTVTIN